MCRLPAKYNVTVEEIGEHIEYILNFYVKNYNKQFYYKKVHIDFNKRFYQDIHQDSLRSEVFITYLQKLMIDCWYNFMKKTSAFPRLSKKVPVEWGVDEAEFKVQDIEIVGCPELARTLKPLIKAPISWTNRSKRTSGCQLQGLTLSLACGFKSFNGSMRVGLK